MKGVGVFYIQMVMHVYSDCVFLSLHSTLRYANRAKNIKNKPRINEDPKDALLRQYQEEIQQLKLMLLGQMDVPAELRGQSHCSHMH